MEKPISKYSSLVFDCDGVILNSNKIKTQAFYEVARCFGLEHAQALVDYHITNGGISRYAKFEYFITQILNKPFDKILNQELLNKFAELVNIGLMSCEIIEGLDLLKAHTPDSNWMIVSGGDQQELLDVFKSRDLVKYFEGGIYGSPDNKQTIIAREIEKNNIKNPSLFIGDSKYDYLSAKTANLDFIFLTKWTELDNWKEFCYSNGLITFRDLIELTNYSIK